MMKLYMSLASPFVRKVRLMVREAGLSARVEEVPTVVSPIEPNAALGRDNPLAKLPTLVTDEGFALFDSPVICEYLDSLNTGLPLFPREGTARWRALRLQAAADGILDAAILVRYQQVLCPSERRWPAWIDGQSVKWRQGLDFLEAEAATGALDGGPTIGSLAAAATLGWLDFRYPGEDWRGGRPHLTRWFAGFSQRPSMIDTAPRA
jgi:glutathione S-transferase